MAGMEYSESLDKFSCDEINKLLKNKHGKKWFELEQEVLIGSCKDLGVSNKINAIKTYLMNNSFFFDEDVFEKMVLAVNSKYIMEDEDQEFDLEEAILAIDELKKVDNRKVEFCDEIKAKIAIEAFSEGYVLLRDSLSFAQDFLDKLNKNTNESLKKKIRKKIAEFENEPDFSILSSKTDKVSIQVNKIIYSKMVSKIKSKYEIE